MFSVFLIKSDEVTMLFIFVLENELTFKNELNFKNGLNFKNELNFKNGLNFKMC
jgi:hypothetical protein